MGDQVAALDAVVTGTTCVADPLSMPELAPPDETGLLQWHGAQYAWSDLEDALALLLSPHVSRSQHLAAQYEDPIDPATWKLCSSNGHTLLRTLAFAHLTIDPDMQHRLRLILLCLLLQKKKKEKHATITAEPSDAESPMPDGQVCSLSMQMSVCSMKCLLQILLI